MSTPQKVAVVSGAAQGLGAAVADELASRGMRIVVVDINGEGGTESARKIAERHGVDAFAVELDVADADALDRLAERVLAEYGRVDVLINAAGIAEDAETLDVTNETLQRVIQVNLFGTIVACRAFAPALIETKGAIVNFSSIAALAGVRPEHHVAYDATKSGVIAATRTLAVEWAPHGVRVNAIAPGYSATPILDGVGANTPEIMDAWISQVPQRRLMQPSEIAKVVAFLASDDAVAITGQTVPADGGYLAAK
ncbi:SDR family oxidoreductase [Leucobacter allii]|uniref:SDR family NAD(P)-dependent oxidoreductase n=1 Tax=Leucobacter allii TaxID=2932247 RepID=UPI001FD40EC3|nr:SDR family NAD(P)-dependent oxidoreductase [Leucobacter allii]UOR01361.1 SDR family oxidoreductase [Leucobacter allii]